MGAPTIAAEEYTYGELFAVWCADTGRDRMDADALLDFDDVITAATLAALIPDGGF